MLKPYTCGQPHKQMTDRGVPLITGATFLKEGRLSKINRWGRHKTLLEWIKPMWRVNLTLALKSLTFQYGVDCIRCSESHVVHRLCACCSCNRPVTVHTTTLHVIHDWAVCSSVKIALRRSTLTTETDGLNLAFINLYPLSQYNFACCFVWVWNLVAHIEGVWE